jgi:hypothetical protein
MLWRVLREFFIDLRQVGDSLIARRRVIKHQPSRFSVSKGPAVRAPGIVGDNGIADDRAKTITFHHDKIRCLQLASLHIM